MAEIVANAPEFVRLFELGVNDQGEIIHGITLSLAKTSEKPISRLIVGAHHGNERFSAESAMNFARHVLSILRDPATEHHSAFSSQIFHIVPVLNIGGFNRNRRHEMTSGGIGVDPNRDYPDVCAKDKRDFQLKSTRALAQFIVHQEIAAAVTIHGYIGTLTYPWGIHTSDTHTPDHAVYDLISSQAAQANGYETGTHSDLIYPAAGAFEDWAYHRHGVWTLLLELAHEPDLQRDSQALATFFALAPGVRSSFHEHTGTCTEAVDRMLMSRP